MYRASLHHRTTTLYVLIDHVQSVQKLRLHTAHDAKIQLHGRLAVPMPRDVLRQTQRYTFTYIIQHPNTQACIYECITGTHTHTHTHTHTQDQKTTRHGQSMRATSLPGNRSASEHYFPHVAWTALQAGMACGFTLVVFLICVANCVVVCWWESTQAFVYVYVRVNFAEGVRQSIRAGRANVCAHTHAPLRGKCRKVRE